MSNSSQGSTVFGVQGTVVRGRSHVFIRDRVLASASILLSKDKVNKDKVNRYKGCVKRKGKQEHRRGG